MAVVAAVGGGAINGGGSVRRRRRWTTDRPCRGEDGDSPAVVGGESRRQRLAVVMDECGPGCLTVVMDGCNGYGSSGQSIRRSMAVAAVALKSKYQRQHLAVFDGVGDGQRQGVGKHKQTNNYTSE